MSKIQLNERLLTSEFTFGFELEALLRANIVEDMEVNEDEDFDEQVRDNIRSTIDGYFYPSGRHTHGYSDVTYDSSVRSYDDDNDFAFEYSSAVFDATPTNFKRVIDMLHTLDSNGIYTNDTCGFHHHLKFGTMSTEDLLWIYCNLATDPDTFTTFNKFKDYEFNSEYSSISDLLYLGKELINRNWKSAANYLDDSKYRLFRIHPQGTLEWRGPRNFLDKGNLQDIKDFYKLLNHLIGNIKNYMDSKYLNGTTITREKLFQEISPYLPDETKKSMDEKITDETADRLVDILKRKLYLFLKIPKTPDLDKHFRAVAKKYGTTFLRRVLQIISHNKTMGYYTDAQILDCLKYIKDVFMEIDEYTSDNLLSYFTAYGNFFPIKSLFNANEILKTLGNYQPSTLIYEYTNLLNTYKLEPIPEVKDMLVKKIEKVPYLYARCCRALVNQQNAYGEVLMPYTEFAELGIKLAEKYLEKPENDFWAGIREEKENVNEFFKNVGEPYSSKWKQLLEQYGKIVDEKIKTF